MTSFDERATEWDTPERVGRAESAAAAIRAAVPLTTDLRVIEIGAGTGLLALAVAREVGSVVLADPSAGMLAVARQKVAAAGLRNVRTMSFALTVDPLPDERFDLVVSLMAFHHVRDIDAGLDALFSLLEGDGRLAVIDLDTEDGTFHSDPAADVHHGFDRADLGRRAEAAGFLDVAFETVDRIEKDDRDYSLFLLTARRP
jgi:ubiquinone/menaquinone biosynthesis C-methylase UbiE